MLCDVNAINTWSILSTKFEVNMRINIEYVAGEFALKWNS